MRNGNDVKGSAGWFALTLLWLYTLALALMGAAMAYGGGLLILAGGSAYYIVAGVLIVASAGLLAARRRAGAWLFGAVLAGTTIWAIWEVGFDFWGLLPRMLMLFCFGLWLVMPWTQAALRRGDPERRTGARRGVVICVGAIASVVLGALLSATLSDHPEDPRFQAGYAPFQTGTPLAHDGDAGADWPYFGGDLGGTRFSPLTQITRENVGSLEPEWEVDVGKVPGMNASPVKIGDRLYTCDNQNGIFALEAETGRQIWFYDGKGVYGSSCRGVAYFEVPQTEASANGLCDSRILAGNATAQLIALDAATGALCPGFGRDGLVDLTRGMGNIDGDVVGGYYRVTSAPMVVRGKIIIGGWITDNQYWGSPSGVIRAFDAVTGEFAWAWDLGNPEDHSEPTVGEHYTHSTPNSWAPMAADAKLGLVYLPTGNATPDFFGGNRRPFDDEFSSSVVALNAETGALVWHFQTLHHDLWDHDVPAQASLLDLPGEDGAVIPALVQPTKQGEIFVLNRVTGEPVFEVKETPVPQAGAVEDERLSPTQPRSDNLPSFRGATLQEADMWGVSPLDQLYCRVMFKRARYEGPQTPPGLSPSVQFPAAFGAINWGGVAVDPTKGIVVVNSNLLANYVRLIPREEAEARGMQRQGEWGNPFELALGGPQEETPYGVLRPYWLTGLGIPCNAPPYGLISAIDLNTGKLIWSKSLGTSLGSGPFGIKLPLALPMGTPNHGGSLITDTGLVFIGAAKDNKLRAYDLYSGDLVWSYDLPGGGHSAPISYTLNGRQYIVIHAGGSYAVQSRMSTKMIAFALPERLVGISE